MIKLIEDINIVKSFENTDSLFYRLYGDFCLTLKRDKSIFLFWTDEKELLLEYNGSALFLCGYVGDEEELLGFINMIAPESIMCSENNRNILTQLGLVEVQCGTFFLYKSENSLKEFEGNTYSEIRYKDLHRLLMKSGLESDYYSFVTGLSEYISASCGITYGEYQNNELISGAAITGITDKSAVLTAIAVDERYRKQGLGKKLFDKINTKLNGRDVLVFTDEKEQRKDFYFALGFEKTGEWFVFE